MQRVLLVLFCVGVAATLGYDPGLRVRFGVTSIGEDYFISLPTTTSQAIAQGWTQAPRPDTTLPSLNLLCHRSYIVCVLYDDTEYVAGLQIAVREDKVTDTVYDWQVQGFARWVPGDGNTYRSIQQYFVDQDFLDIPAQIRVSTRDPYQLLQIDGIWVHGNNRTLVHIPGNTADIHASGFTEQACIPFMGLHHYYEMSSDLECAADTLLPFFALTASDELIATGLVIYGKLEEADGDWFERPDTAAVQMIVPRGPQCLYDLASSPGLVTIHMYYIDAPWTLSC